MCGVWCCCLMMYVVCLCCNFDCCKWVVWLFFDQIKEKVCLKVGFFLFGEFFDLLSKGSLEVLVDVGLVGFCFVQYCQEWCDVLGQVWWYFVVCVVGFVFMEMVGVFGVFLFCLCDCVFQFGDCVVQFVVCNYIVFVQLFVDEIQYIYGEIFQYVEILCCFVFECNYDNFFFILLCLCGVVGECWQIGVWFCGCGLFEWYISIC